MPFNPDNPPWFDLDPNDPIQCLQLQSLGYFNEGQPGYSGEKLPAIHEKPPSHIRKRSTHARPNKDPEEGPSNKRARTEPAPSEVEVQEQDGSNQVKKRRGRPKSSKTVRKGPSRGRPRGRPIGRHALDTRETRARRNSQAKQKRQEAKDQREKGLRPGEDSYCDYCLKNPDKYGVLERHRCNFVYVNDKFQLECQNCADYRSNNPGVQHVCRVGNKDFAGKRYGVNDPVFPMVTACDECIGSGLENSCDVDEFLSVKCTKCISRKIQCHINSRHIIDSRPRQIITPWFRRMCETCSRRRGHVPEGQQCTWLKDRRTWDQPCSYCVSLGMLCVNKIGEAFGTAGGLEAGDWKSALSLNDGEFFHLRRLLRFRKTCKPCTERNGKGGHECRVSLKEPYASCLRCTELGIDCFEDVPQAEIKSRMEGIPGGFIIIDDNSSEAFSDSDSSEGKELAKKERVYYPILNLGRVGFGEHAPFQTCQSCKEKGRNCDHQRPCDSCEKHGDRCDPWTQGIHRMADGCSRRFANPPGPLYYLAMGYGPGGVDDIKDGTLICHHIGPVVPKYSLDYATPNRSEIYQAVVQERRLFHPWGIPPQSSSKGGMMNGRRVSELSIADLHRILQDTGLTEGPAQHPSYREAVSRMKAIRCSDVSERSLSSFTATEPRASIETSVPAEVATPLRAQLQTVSSQAVASPSPSPSPSVSIASAALLPAGGEGTQDHQDVDWFAEILSQGQDYFPELDFDTLGEMFEHETGASGNEYLAQGEQSGSQITDAGNEEKDVEHENALFTEIAQPQPTFDSSTALESPQKGGLNTSPSPQPPPVQAQEDLLQNDQNFSHGLYISQSYTQPSVWDHWNGFNPFLGHDVFKEPKRVSSSIFRTLRWAQSDFIDDLEMDHWDYHRIAAAKQVGNPADRPFSRGLDESFPDNPARDVLEAVPIVPGYYPLDSSHEQKCMEPIDYDNKPIGICNNGCEDPMGCRDITHRSNDPTHFLVCDECNEQTKSVLIDEEYDPLTMEEILSMRAYLCDTCARGASESHQFASWLPHNGTNHIWGELSSSQHPTVLHGLNTQHRGAALLATGCSCGHKLFSLRLCRYHRLRHAERAMQQSALMREWLLLRFQRLVCPSCLFTRGRHAANSSAHHAGFRNTNGGPTSCLCLTCLDWVVNQRNNANNEPQLVPGQLGHMDVNELFLRRGMVPGKNN
ncbi:hypothetical protein BGZ63DRAFT_403032 [Mariannaea sp. PMI_226]|nr:hypothetical protein BGZ63DRAFT_403032 [Mariannaea sp. PMI_226]